MKKGILLSIGGLMIVLVGLLFACQKENNTVVAGAATQQQVVNERQDICPEIHIGYALGLQFCGLPAGVTPCTTCSGFNLFRANINSNKALFNIGTSDEFCITNPTGEPRRVAIYFNCPVETTVAQLFNIPAGTTVCFQIINVNGCCQAVPC